MSPAEKFELIKSLMEMENRMHGLGCDRCIYIDEISPVCEIIIKHPEKFFSCGFCCERREETT